MYVESEGGATAPKPVERRDMTVTRWFRRALRAARRGRRRTAAAKLRAVAEAARHEFPTADIDEMLREIEAGYRIR